MFQFFSDAQLFLGGHSGTVPFHTFLLGYLSSAIAMTSFCPWFIKFGTMNQALLWIDIFFTYCCCLAFENFQRVDVGVNAKMRIITIRDYCVTYFPLSHEQATDFTKHRYSVEILGTHDNTRSVALHPPRYQQGPCRQSTIVPFFDMHQQVNHSN